MAVRSQQVVAKGAQLCRSSYLALSLEALPADP
jgi:hypothetical protein